MRESWRPFAPSVLAERARHYFDLPGSSPYMLETAPVRQALRRPMEMVGQDGPVLDLLDLVRQPRSPIPAVTHVDYSARVQTVSAQESEDYYLLLRAFESLTGCAVLVNTSFNVRGEPIVCSPWDALSCFWQTDIDLLVLEDHFLWKHEQDTDHLAQAKKRTFELD